MKNKFLNVALLSLSILLAGSSVANAGSHFSFGFYAPAPIIYQPAPVYVAPRPVYVAAPAYNYFPDCRYNYCNSWQMARFNEWQERRWQRHEEHEEHEEHERHYYDWREHSW